MAFYKQDIVDINLNTGNIHRSFLNHAIGYKNDDADRFGIRTFRDGVPQDLTGASCQAVFMAPNGSKIALTSYGTVSGNVAYVTLPPACYDYEGQFCLAIQLVGGGVTGTMRIVDGMVVNTGASGTVAPTSAVPTYQEILAQYDAMVAATAAANGAIAATYSQKTYAVGEYCIHDGDLKRCIVPITTAESYTAAHWTSAVLGQDVSDLKNAFINKTGLLGNVETTYTNNGITLSGETGSANSERLASDTISNIAKIKSSSGYEFILHAYDGATHIGIWNGTKFTSTGSWVQSFDGSDYSYSYRLLVRVYNQEHHAIAPNEGVTNIAILSKNSAEGVCDEINRELIGIESEVNNLNRMAMGNVINPLEWTKGKIIHSSMGQPSDYTSTAISEYIDITGITKLYYCGEKKGRSNNDLLCLVGEYKSDKSFISGGRSTLSTDGTPITLKSNTKYIRIAFGYAQSTGLTFEDQDLQYFGVKSSTGILETEVNKANSIERISKQINNGFLQTSADGSSLAYDGVYGIAYNVYMGNKGSYGESRGNIWLTYFPLTQPENQKTVNIATGSDVYAPNILLISPNVVRCYYQRNSGDISDHTTCYKDYNISTETLSEEHECKFVGEGGTVALKTNNILAYLEANGYTDSSTTAIEPIGLQGCTIFYRSDTEKYYCSICNDGSYPVLCYSSDGETWTPFAIYPSKAQYEFAYAYYNGKYYALCRTSAASNSVVFTVSSDDGVTWSTPSAITGSIQCRPRVIAYESGILYACNIYNNDTGYRSAVQGGRTQINIWWDDGTGSNVNEMEKMYSAHSIFGIVNICLISVVGDVYMSYSTSRQALDYQNRNDHSVKGKDSVMFAELGYLAS